MKEIELPDTGGKILLSRIQGKYYATGARCTRMSHSLGIEMM